MLWLARKERRARWHWTKLELLCNLISEWLTGSFLFSAINKIDLREDWETGSTLWFASGIFFFLAFFNLLINRENVFTSNWVIHCWQVRAHFLATIQRRHKREFKSMLRTVLKNTWAGKKCNSNSKKKTRMQERKSEGGKKVNLTKTRRWEEEEKKMSRWPVSPAARSCSGQGWSRYQFRHVPETWEEAGKAGFSSRAGIQVQTTPIRTYLSYRRVLQVLKSRRVLKKTGLSQF